MRLVACLVLACGACGFSQRLGDTPGDGGGDTIDAPPTTPSVKFIAVTSPVAMLRPGLYGFDVIAELQNDLPTEITSVAVTLTFRDGTIDRAADFRWRDADAREGVTVAQPRSIAAGGTAMYRFRVDALPWAVPPGPILVNGAATFVDDATALSATPLDTPLAIPFAPLNPPIVVDTADDEDNGNSDLCLREALARAATQPGLDRIVFDPSEFPPGAPVTSVLDESLGELTLNHDVVIDGRGAGFVLAADSNWESPSGRYGLRIAGGTVVVSNVGFRDWGHGYPNEDVSQDNCGSGAQGDGGAIRIDDGTLILDGNRFEDPGVNERNCYAASVRVEGGSGHRILNNTWTDQSMDAIFIDAATVEITGNLMNAGGNLDKVDECIFVNTQGGQPLWIVGNICVDHEYSGVIARGTDPGALFVFHNTFVRNGRRGLSAVRREQATRQVVLRNNAYVGNAPAAITLDGNGAAFDVAYEAVTGSMLFAGNSSMATVEMATVLTPADAMLVDAGGATRDALTPLAGSPLVGTAVDTLDVNGPTPDHHNGSGPERGAIELP